MSPFSAADVTSRITGAIRDAARVTGTGFDFLLKTAMRESNMDPQARASTSSAAGLFQFIENTWLSMVKEEGAQHGLSAYADEIVRGPSGRYSVPDQAARSEILALRHDPQAASAMAGELTNRNREHLVEALGREPSEGELYIAHFLGAGGAASLIRMAAETPDASAAQRFPQQAAANRSIFFARDGGALGAVDVYQRLVSKHGAGPVTAVARAEPAMPAEPEPTARSPLADGYAWSDSMSAPVFHALFTGAGAAPAAGLATAPWAAFAPQAASASAHFAAMVAPQADMSPIAVEEDRAPAFATGAPTNLLPYAGRAASGGGLTM